MPEYQNPHHHTVHITGPEGQIVKIKSRQVVNLPAYYEIYRQRGFLVNLNSNETLKPSAPIISQKAETGNTPAKPVIAPIITQLVQHHRQPQPQPQPQPQRRTIIGSRQNTRQPLKEKILVDKIVGKQVSEDERLKIQRTAVGLIKNSKGLYPISNNIGVGILSYNRKESLERLINSINQNTNLNATTVFVSDDCSTDPELIMYLDELRDQSNIVVIKNKTRLGVAGNSNRLLRALSRFKYGILLNDDIEILKPGWEYFYADGLKKSMMHHLVFRQAGIYGADKGMSTVVNGVQFNVVNDKPHGALLAFTNEYFRAVGAFNEDFGYYGLEHIEWSSRAFANKMQKEGYYDLHGSESYIRLHKENTSIDDKNECLKSARDRYDSLKKLKHEFTQESSIPKVTFIVPFREQERTGSLNTVLNNIRAQKYPDIEIILVEEDHIQKIDVSQYEPLRYYKVSVAEEHFFNKAKAFNLGVSKATSNKIILHDADMLAINGYTSEVSDVLDEFESCHLGSTVVYADRASTDRINNSGVVTDPAFERVVGYYEGGSLACTRDTYWKIGGFNEDFWGYGCEDCDFYERMSGGSKYLDNRTYNLLHLYHGRSDGWFKHHDTNKAIHDKLKELTIRQRIELQISQVTGMVNC